MSHAKQRMPAVFFGHGNPLFVFVSNRYTAAWRAHGEALPRPAAILMISAHWYTRGTAVTAMAAPRTIHDFGGFPRELFEVQYPAPGSPDLARRVQQVLKQENERHDTDSTEGWGLDHGTWSVLIHAFPAADIPVVQLSIDATQPPQWHYALARRLAVLRDEDVLIVGSGNIVHNLGRMNRSANAPPFEWAQRFSHQLEQQLLAGDHHALIDFQAAGADARWSVPTPEHYLPLLYVIAQQQPGEPTTFPVTGMDMGAIAMHTIKVGL